MSRILLKEEQEGYKEQLLEFAEALVFSHTLPSKKTRFARSHRARRAFAL